MRFSKIQARGFSVFFNILECSQSGDHPEKIAKFHYTTDMEVLD
jgi:hypothetical protein